MLSKRVFNIHEFVDILVIIGTLLGVCGTYWDIKWHIDYGRDTFWIPPHLMVYAGVALVFVCAAVALWNARRVKNKIVEKRLQWAILAILASVSLQILAAPIDDLWHRIFGLDVTVWSPPHLLLLFAGFLIAMSFIYFQRLYMHIAKLDKASKLTSDELKLEVMFAIALVGLNIVLAEFEYFRTIPFYHVSQQRPDWLYLALLAVQFAFIFSLAKTVIRSRFSATRIVLFYYVLRLLISLVLFGRGSWPILPPLVIIPALIFDLSGAKDAKNTAFTAAAFSIIFYFVEIFYMKTIGITKYLPQSFIEVVLAAIASAVFAGLAFYIGKRVLKKVILN